MSFSARSPIAPKSGRLRTEAGAVWYFDAISSDIDGAQAVDEATLAQYAVALGSGNEWPQQIVDIILDFNRRVGYNDDVQRHYYGLVNGQPGAPSPLAVIQGVPVALGVQ